MTYIQRILTTSPSHYVELISREPLKVEQDSSGWYIYEGFYEVLLKNEANEIRLRLDELVPSDLLVTSGDLIPPVGSPDVEETFEHKKSRIKIAGNGTSHNDLGNGKLGSLLFWVHISSPIIPRTGGLWLWLRVQFDLNQGGLYFAGGTGRLKYKLGWVKVRGQPPQWLANKPVLWELETGADKRELSHGNALLSADWNDTKAVANLVHIDESLKGQAKGDYSFGLKPVVSDGVTEICTELVINKEFPKSGPPPFVCDSAILLTDKMRSSVPLSARGLHLRCSSGIDNQGARTGWTLEWLDVPGNPGKFPRHIFSLESFTQLHLSAHAFGLATTRARNRMSVIPTWISTDDKDATCNMVFHVTRDGYVAKETRLTHVFFPNDTAVRMTCGGALDVAGNPLEWIVVVKKGDAHTPPKGGQFVDWTLDPMKGASKPHRFGAGSVLLEADAAEFMEGEFTLSISPEGQHYRRGPLEASIELDFKSSRLRPLSMDPEIGFETLSSVVERPRPWTVDLSEETTGPLTLRESAKHNQSRMLRLTVKMQGEDSRNTDAVLIDTSPFTVVRVQTREQLKGREIYAEYLDDADQAPEWRFFSETGRMVAVLPPQGIGEEMVKGHLRIDGQVVPNGLFDYRLTPPAMLELDRTDIDTARSEAPWSLRRLLARRSGTTGVKLDRARFELLYGLEARLESPGLRIAELEGFVGRVPYPDALWNAYLRRDKEQEKQKKKKGLITQTQADYVEEVYAKQVSDWQKALWRRPSWWRVYREVVDRRRLVLDSGVQFRLRPTRQTANPFSIDKYAPKTVEAADRNGRLPLRGGVDWPFQSPNIYNELLDQPVSSSGSVEGLVFGTLGGEGSQTAAFNNGKTLIISNTRQGRLDSLTLIRVGRIAMTWHKARHVIVYERTTRRAPRYDYQTDVPPNHDDLEVQPPFKGLAALRKVREYIEITEPRRRYPDSSTARPAAGPLVQCTFGTTVIPVMSSWGHDVKQGFAIALRGPIPDGKEKYFPDPHVFLDMARPESKGGGFVSQRIKSTNRLVFFTSTRPEDNGDTDQWPAWPDIDFPAIAPPPPPVLPFRSGFNGRRQPDAETVDPLMERFTFELEQAEEGVNLMHGRNSPGLEAKVTNFCLARGMPQRNSMPAAKVVEDAQRAVDAFSASRALIADGLRDLAWAARDRAATNGNALVSADAQFRRDLNNLLQQLKTVPQVPDVPEDSIDWAKQQSDRGTAFKKGIEDEGKALKRQLELQLRRIQSSSTENFEQVRLEAATLANAVALQAQERLGTLSLVGVEVLKTGQDFLKNWLSANELRLEQISAGAISTLDALEKQIAAEPARLAELEAIWRESVARIPQELLAIIGTLEQLSEGAAGKFFSQLADVGKVAETFQARFRNAIEPELRKYAKELDRWLKHLPRFKPDEKPDFALLRKDISERLNVNFRAMLKKIIDDFQKHIDGLGAWDKKLQDRRGELEKDARALQSAIAGATNLTQLGVVVSKEANGLEVRLKKKADSLVDTMKVPKDVQVELDKLQGNFNALKDYKTEIEKAVAGVKLAMNGTMAELDAAVRSQVANAEKYLHAGSRQLENWARGTIGNALEIGRRDAEATLEAVRVLAEGPVTEGLKATRDQLGYYYQTALDTVGLTPATAVFNDLGQEVLNALSANVPFDRLGERLLPKLEGMMLRDLFPDFCGIKLTDLLRDLDIKLDDTLHYDWLTVQHGFDKDRLSAWARVSIDKKFDENGTLFDLGPVKLRLLEPLFFAQADVIYEDGRQRQIVSGRLEADFELSLNDKAMVTMAKGKLAFDERGKLDFQFDSENIELAEELKFVTNALRSLMPQVEGLTLTPLIPAGINAELCLPLPDIGTGAFTLTGVTLNSHLGLLVGDGFEIRTGLWLSKPERPFGLAVLFLGGGGWFGIDANYKPPTKFVTRVSVGVSAGAFVAVNFGFASGSAGLLFTAGLDFCRDWQSGSGSTAISLGILVWGEFSILGIASAGIRLMLRITYTEQGGMKGTGTLSVRIKICWCYTLRVNRTVVKEFSRGSARGQHKQLANTRAAPIMPLGAPGAIHPATLPAPDISGAVSRYFDTLAT